ncbi:hypothetical protein FRC17_010564 [Serendipita sp. 399]|nr:hypothetical protein FRC17_010564 [Serendipita sp. 399]
MHMNLLHHVEAEEPVVKGNIIRLVVLKDEGVGLSAPEGVMNVIKEMTEHEQTVSAPDLVHLGTALVLGQGMAIQREKTRDALEMIEGEMIDVIIDHMSLQAVERMRTTKGEGEDSAMQEETKEVGEAGEEDVMALMGFTGFGSTKGQAVEGNQEGAVKINKQRTWRQYMNRRGGFNRPLDKVK